LRLSFSALCCLADGRLYGSKQGLVPTHSLPSRKGAWPSQARPGSGRGASYCRRARARGAAGLATNSRLRGVHPALPPCRLRRVDLATSQAEAMSWRRVGRPGAAKRARGGRSSARACGLKSRTRRRDAQRRLRGRSTLSLASWQASSAGHSRPTLNTWQARRCGPVPNATKFDRRTGSHSLFGLSRFLGSGPHSQPTPGIGGARGRFADQ
jgi:hypothetical protein